MRPVTIAGGGIAGMSAALGLASHGIPSEIFEKSNAAGASRHGDFEGLENWIFPEKMKVFGALGLDPASLASFSVSEFLVHCPPNDPVKIQAPESFFSVVSRGTDSDSIDQWLYRACLEQEIDIRFGESCDIAEADIIATGSQKAAAYIQGGSFSTQLADQVHLLLGDAYAPKGYAYVIVHSGKGTVATAFKKPKNSGINYLEETVEYFQSAGMNITPEKTFASRGSFQLPARNPFSNQIAVGEAGGYQDLLFGFGMNIGMMSGRMAASYLAGKHNQARNLNKMLRKKLRLSYLNRVLYERLNDSMKFRLVQVLSESENPVEKLRQAYEWNWRRMMTMASGRRPVEIHFS